MKRVFTLLLSVLIFSGVSKIKAQSFSVQHDTTIHYWTGGVQNFVNGVINPTTVSTDSITLLWKVIASDFPADWITASSSPITGVCDNNLCYNQTYLYPSSTIVTSKKYGMGTGDFHVQTNLTTASNGSHYITVRMYNQAIPSDSVTATFIINKFATSVAPVKFSGDVTIYPNPAVNELNVVYDASADVKNIAVYSIIGKVMMVYKVTGNSGANLNLENMPSGVYFARLMNSRGDVVATKKFTKQ